MNDDRKDSTTTKEEEETPNDVVDAAVGKQKQAVIVQNDQGPNIIETKDKYILENTTSPKGDTETEQEVTSLEAKGEGGSDSNLLKVPDNENLEESTDGRSREKRSSQPTVAVVSKEFSPLNEDDSKLSFRSEDSSSSAPLTTTTRPTHSSSGRGRVDAAAQHGTIVNASKVEEGTFFHDIADSELAVAIAIDEEDEEDVVELEKLVSVHAVEYDPDSKPPIYMNRRFRLYGFGGCCFVIIAVFALVSISVANNNSISYIYLANEPTEAPTDAPTNARENVYRNYFAAEVSPLVFEQGTPLSMASNWIIYEDPQQLTIDDPRLLQRFILAFWYYHSSAMGSGPWLSCNPPGPGEDDNCTFEEFGREEDGTIVYTEAPNSIRWLSSQDECKWQGVICGSGTVVVGLRIVGQKLTGTLPTEMRALPFLQVMQLSYNMLSGTLPPSYANFRHLLSLEVHGNVLTGEIPTEFYDQKSRSLITLNVGDNILSGTLDTKIGQLTALKGLHLYGNNMNGTIPSEVGDLKYLTYTRVSGNGFTGQIPRSLGTLVQLTEFWYNDCSFTGEIPSEFGSLRRMTDFRLSSNFLSSTIPPSIFDMARAQVIFLDGNELTGPLPSTELVQLTDLIQLRVSRNNLTGPIPSQLGNMPSLRLVWLHLNLFTGPLPDSVCEANVPNGLNFIQVDCAPLDDPPNPCRCCSACCNRTTDLCLTTEDN